MTRSKLYEAAYRLGLDSQVHDWYQPPLVYHPDILEGFKRGLEDRYVVSCRG